MIHRITKLALMFLTAGILFAGNGPKHSPDLERVAEGKKKVDVIVQLTKTQGPKKKRGWSKKAEDRAKSTANKAGGHFKKLLGDGNSAVISISPGKLKKLAKDRDVVYVSPDRGVGPTLEYASAAVSAGIAQQYGYDGRGVGIAVIDSGIKIQTSFENDGGSRIVYDEVFGVAKLKSTKDGYGHGTHIAGIAAGAGLSGADGGEIGIPGIAPGASLIDFQVLDDEGAGKDSDVIEAIDRAIALKSVYNIRILNISLGRPVFESYTVDPLCQAVERAWKAGIVVVVAAGNLGRDNSVENQGYGTITAPGNSPYVITVGAMKTKETVSAGDDEIASYSSKGPTFLDHVAKPDLVAPGNRVVSLITSLNATFPKDYPSNIVKLSVGDETAKAYRLSGTSMAAPVVSGAVALLLQKEPGLSPDQVKARLMLTASKQFPSSGLVIDPATGETFSAPYDVFTVGAGYLDVAAALASNDVAYGSALSPIAVFDEATGEVYLVRDSSAIWGTSAMWGTLRVWGGTSVYDNSALWGTSAVWGSFGTRGMSAIWGTSAVWGSFRTRAFSALWGTAVMLRTSAMWGSSDTVHAEAVCNLIQGER